MLLIGLSFGLAKGFQRYHRLITMMGLAESQMVSIHHLTTKMVIFASGGPFRDSPFFEDLQRLQRMSSNDFKENIDEVKCFRTEKEATAYAEKLKHNVMVSKNNYPGGPCWHVMSSDIAYTDCEKCAHRQPWKENECGIGNPAWPDPACPGFIDESTISGPCACSDPDCPAGSKTLQ